VTDSVEYCGVIYDRSTDWRSFVAHTPYQGLEKRLDIQSALGALAEALQGTPMEIGLADAALEIIEHGAEDKMKRVESAGWAKAPNSFERMLALTNIHPGRCRISGLNGCMKSCFVCDQPIRVY
jgi:hypothetical protein